MFGFELDAWDYLTFVVLFLLAAGFLAAAVFLLGLPGRIALARKHPEAEAVSLMGYVGFLAIVPWIQALIWAFKPTQVVDIRRGPIEEQKAIDAEIAKLKGVTAAQGADTPGGRD